MLRRITTWASFINLGESSMQLVNDLKRPCRLIRKRLTQVINWAELLGHSSDTLMQFNTSSRLCPGILPIRSTRYGERWPLLTLRQVSMKMPGTHSSNFWSTVPQILKDSI